MTAPVYPLHEIYLTEYWFCLGKNIHTQLFGSSASEAVGFCFQFVSIKMETTARRWKQEFLEDLRNFCWIFACLWYSDSAWRGKTNTKVNNEKYLIWFFALLMYFRPKRESIRIDCTFLPFYFSCFHTVDTVFPFHSHKMCAWRYGTNDCLTQVCQCECY